MSGKSTHSRAASLSTLALVALGLVLFYFYQVQRRAVPVDGPGPTTGSNLASRLELMSAHDGVAVTAKQSGSCLDALILYHEDDRRMFVDNGGLESAKRHLLGVRKFFILSASNQSFSHLLDARVQWVDERVAPFNKAAFQGCKRPAGWLYQQALKMWAVAHLDITCNDLLVVDCDIVWLRDLDVRVPVPQPHEPHPDPGQIATAPAVRSAGVAAYEAGLAFKYMYCLSSMDSGAWYGDITNAEYHHFVNWLLGMPKVLRDTHTAINNWQVMQRDVMLALEANLEARGLGKIQEALRVYGHSYNGMSEYEAYFSFVWTHYRSRVQPTYLPWALQSPRLCNYQNATMVNRYRHYTPMVYLTCHDNYGSEIYYINCRMRGATCDPDHMAAVFEARHAGAQVA